MSDQTKSRFWLVHQSTVIQINSNNNSTVLICNIHTYIHTHTLLRAKWWHTDTRGSMGITTTWPIKHDFTTIETIGVLIGRAPCLPLIWCNQSEYNLRSITPTTYGDMCWDYIHPSRALQRPYKSSWTDIRAGLALIWLVVRWLQAGSGGVAAPHVLRVKLNYYNVAMDGSIAVFRSKYQHITFRSKL
jgi:hypothetical protein